MLAMTQLIGFGVGASGLSASYVTNDVDTSGGTAISYGTLALGEAALDRYLCVMAIGVAGVVQTCDSCTVAGNSATRHINYSDGGGVSMGAFIIALASGTTGAVVVNFSGATLRSAISIWRMTGLQSSTPTDTLTAKASPATGAIDVSAGGVVIAMTAGGAADTTWTGVTESFDGVAFSTNYASGGMTLLPAGEAGRTITANNGGTTSMLAASFR